MSIGELSVGELSVGELSVGDLSSGKYLLGIIPLRYASSCRARARGWVCVCVMYPFQNTNGYINTYLFPYHFSIYP